MKRNILSLMLLLAVIIILTVTYQIFYPNNFGNAIKFMKGGLTAETTKVPAPVKLTGTLSLSQNPAYKSQSFTAPQTKFKLADFNLKNNTNETINLKKIEVDLATGSNLYITNNYVNNLYLVYGDTTTQILSTVSHANYWTLNSQLPANQTIDISVYCNVNNYIPLNSTINSSMLVSGISANTNTNVYTNSNAALSGQNITFANGSLTLAKDSSTPAFSLIAFNKRVAAGEFKLTTSADSYTLTELAFVVPSYGVGLSVIPAVLDADLYDNDTKSLLTSKPVPIFFDGTDYIEDFKINAPIAINSSKSLTVYYDLKSSINSYATNENIAPILVYAKATNSKGTITDGTASYYSNLIPHYGGITFPTHGIAVNGLNIFKSIPTFSATSSGTTVLNGSNLNLYTFSIAADPSGDISVKQITFIVTLNTPNKIYPHLTRFSLLKGTADYTSSVSITNVINNNYISLLSNYGIGSGIDNNVVLTFTTEEKIPAGKTQTYTLRAYADNFYASTKLGAASVSTYIPTDKIAISGPSYLKVIYPNIYYGLSYSYSDDSFAKYNLLWSDKSTSFPNTHNDFNGNYTDDWYNGYGVLNLPLPNQVITAK